MYEYDYNVNILSQVLIDSKPDDKKCIEYIYYEFEEIILSNIRNNLLYLNNLIKETYDNSYYFLEDEDPFYEININIINLLNTLPIELIDVKSLVSSLVLCNNVTVSNHLLTNFPLNFEKNALLIDLFERIMEEFDIYIGHNKLFIDFKVYYYNDFFKITKYILEDNPDYYINQIDTLEKLYGLTNDKFADYIYEFYLKNKHKQSEIKNINYNKVFGYFCKSNNQVKAEKILRENPNIDLNYENEGDTPFSYACEAEI